MSRRASKKFIREMTLRAPGANDYETISRINQVTSDSLLQRKQLLAPEGASKSRSYELLRNSFNSLNSLVFFDHLLENQGKTGVEILSRL